MINQVARTIIQDFKINKFIVSIDDWDVSDEIKKNLGWVSYDIYKPEHLSTFTKQYQLWETTECNLHSKMSCFMFCNFKQLI